MGEENKRERNEKEKLNQITVLGSASSLDGLAMQPPYKTTPPRTEKWWAESHPPLNNDCERETSRSTISAQASETTTVRGRLYYSPRTAKKSSCLESNMEAQNTLHVLCTYSVVIFETKQTWKVCGCTEYMCTPSLSDLLLLGEKGEERESRRRRKRASPLRIVWLWLARILKWPVTMHDIGDLRFSFHLFIFFLALFLSFNNLLVRRSAQAADTHCGPWSIGGLNTTPWNLRRWPLLFARLTCSSTRFLSFYFLGSDILRTRGRSVVCNSRDRAAVLLFLLHIQRPILLLWARY